MREVWKVSVRKACEALRIDRSLYTYKSRCGEQAGLQQRIKEICQTRVRYGYRRVHVLLCREGWAINMKRTRRLYNELGLQLRNIEAGERSWMDPRSPAEGRSGV